MFMEAEITKAAGNNFVFSFTCRPAFEQEQRRIAGIGVIPYGFSITDIGKTMLKVEFHYV